MAGIGNVVIGGDATGVGVTAHPPTANSQLMLPN
jgi:hypothetical protein